MIDLHPTQCACADCRNRRLISTWDLAAEGYLEVERGDFGSVLKGKEWDREGDRSHREIGLR